MAHPKSKLSDKVSQENTPMIDVVFQLLTFFLFTLKVVSVEGDFSIKMPQPSESMSMPEEPKLPMRVKLTAAADGKISGIDFNNERLTSFAELRQRVLDNVGANTGPSSEAANTELELDCDYDLNYAYVIEAITAVRGTYSASGEFVPMVEKIKFAQPHKPGS